MFSLRINNFRSYKNEVFDFSRINILIGENSSGKSSLFKFLLALKQTFTDSKSRDYNLALTGDYTDLGTFKDVIYYNDDSLSLEFEFIFDYNYYFFFRDGFLLEDYEINSPEDADYKTYQSDKIDGYVGGPIKSKTNVSYTLDKNLDSHESMKTIISNDEIGSLTIFHISKDVDEEKKIILSLKSKCELIYKDFETNEIYNLSVEYNKEGFCTIIVGSSLKNQLYKHFDLSYHIDDLDDSDLQPSEIKQKERIETLWHKMAFLLVSQNYIKYILNKIDYINPLDTKPQRIYFIKDEKRNINIRDIENVVDFFSSTKNIQAKSLNQELKHVLKEFGLAEDFEVIKDDRLPVKELKVMIKDLLSNITDVGYGVALQIPILLKALLAERIQNRKNTILLIEQPEVHLHPKMHAKFIETLLGLGDNNFYFIETHSEHIVRKLQILVKEQKFKLKPEDVSINYLIREKKNTIKSTHRIEQSGRLNPPFPDGFFDNSFMLSRELLD